MLVQISKNGFGIKVKLNVIELIVEVELISSKENIL